MVEARAEQYTVAAIQFEPELGAKATNIARLLALTEEAARAGARLIVLPEMATTGYCWYDRAEIRPHVEPIPGPTTDVFAAVAERYGCYIVVGMPEVAPRTGIFYNSAALIGPAGVEGVYRKTHSFASDQKWAKDGDLGFPVWETPLGRIGILICMDAGYFEPARLLALAGADVLCFPTNWLGERCPGPAWLTRAYENGCYLIAANRYGLERTVQFSGGSCVLNPDGTVQAQQQTGDGIVYGVVALAAARAKSFLPGGPSEKLRARRPALYETLTLSSYLTHPLEFHGMYGQRPLPPERRSSVAVVQAAALAGNPDQNFAAIARALADLAHPDQDAPGAGPVALVVFPEYALTGWSLTEPAAVALTTAAALQWRARLAALAQRYALHFVVGYAERCGSALYSTAVLLGPDGAVACYRKSHVVGTDAAFVAGVDPPPVVDLPLGRVGLLLGTDLCFPEIARTLALAGCDLLAVPASAGFLPAQGTEPLAAASMAARSDLPPMYLPRQRAVENNCYLALAAPPIPDGAGYSGLFGPSAADRRAEVVLGGLPGVAVGRVDTSSVDLPYASVAPVRRKDLVRMRQPHLYDMLQREIAPPD